MFRLTLTPRENLGEKARALLESFPPALGLPKPLELHTASPGLLEIMTGQFGYFRTHKALSFQLLACIRYLAARRFNAPACVDFNGRLLGLAGIDQAGLEALAAHPESAPLEPREQALLAFVDRTLAGPGGADEGALADLRAQAWSDADILDAVLHGAQMQVPALLMRAFAK